MHGSIIRLVESYGYAIVFLFVAIESLGIPLPGETVLVTAGALAALGMPVIHLMTARGVAGAIDRPYAFTFVWALLCLGVTGLFSLFLSVHGLIRLQRGQ